ncbi:MAG: NAD-dependent epimerase/dehydratase [Candidatus Saccharibacteria bacterium]|nr:NAD-dependent epimerase/dehydratase [Candidatus Saccharibacteria bacterium]
MNLVVLGANGKTGQELVNLAVSQGHNVTAITRSPDAFSDQADVRAVKADVFNSSELAKVFAGMDAVLSTLGNNNSKLQLIERSSKAIVEAMQATGVKRLVVELAFGGAASATLTKPTRALNNMVLGKMLEDQKRGVDIITKSHLDWTIVYATMLTNGPLTEKVRVVDSTEKIGLRHKISRADVSFAMLQSLENGRSIKKLPVTTAA